MRGFTFFRTPKRLQAVGSKRVDPYARLHDGMRRGKRGVITPPGDLYGCEYKGFAGEAIRKGMKTKRRQSEMESGTPRLRGPAPEPRYVQRHESARSVSGEAAEGGS